MVSLHKVPTTVGEWVGGGGGRRGEGRACCCCAAELAAAVRLAQQGARFAGIIMRAAGACTDRYYLFSRSRPLTSPNSVHALGMLDWLGIVNMRIHLRSVETEDIKARCSQWRGLGREGAGQASKHDGALGPLRTEGR